MNEKRPSHWVGVIIICNSSTFALFSIAQRLWKKEQIISFCYFHSWHRLNEPPPPSSSSSSTETETATASYEFNGMRTLKERTFAHLFYSKCFQLFSNRWKLSTMANWPLFLSILIHFSRSFANSALCSRALLSNRTKTSRRRKKQPKYSFAC